MIGINHKNGVELGKKSVKKDNELRWGGKKLDNIWKNSNVVYMQSLQLFFSLSLSNLFETCFHFPFP